MKLFGWDWNSKSLRILKLMLRVLGFPGQVYLDISSYVLHADETVVRYKALVSCRQAKALSYRRVN